MVKDGAGKTAEVLPAFFKLELVEVTKCKKTGGFLESCFPESVKIL